MISSSPAALSATAGKHSIANGTPQFEDDVQDALRAIAHQIVRRTHSQSATLEWPPKVFVELSEFLLEESRTLFASEKSLRLNLPATSIGLVSLDRAQQIGRLAFEVVMNALEHAHPTGIPVQMDLECTWSSDGRLTIRIGDDGVGLPETLDPYRAGGCGLQRIRLLAKTMNADLRIESDALGTTFIVSLPAEGQLVSDRDRVGELQQVLASIVESSDDAILSKDLNGIITSWNAGCERLFGYTAEEAVGHSVTMLIPEERHDEEPAILARLRRGEKINHYETVRRRKDGGLIDISLSVSPIRDKDGTIVGAAKVARDITERRRAAERQEMLLGEMRHRVKNLATVIEALARQSRPRDEPAVAEFIDAFVGRVHALLSTGELTLGSPTRKVELGQLLNKVLQPFVDPNRADRITIRGPSLVIAEKTAGNLALAIHELATNALKYGALSNSSGRVLISWTVEPADADRRISLEWRERGGPPATKPKREGFGSRVVSSALARERDAQVKQLFEPDGVHCTFDFTMNAND